MIKNMMTLSLGTLIAQLIPIFLSPILARIYSPEDYGIWGIFSSTALICSIFMTGRYEAAILRPKENTIANHLLLLCLFITCCVIAIISIGFFVAKKFGFFLEVGSTFLISLILYLLFNSVTQIFSFYANREERYKKIALGSIARSSIQGITRLGFGFMGINKMGLVYGTVLGVISNAGILLYPFKKLKIILKDASWMGIKQVGLKYKRFPLFELPSSALNSLSTNLPLLLLALFFSEEKIGFFSMAVSLMFLPISFITSAQSQVYYKRSCSLEKYGIGSLTYKIFTANYIFGAIVLTLFELFAGVIFAVFLGSRWIIAGDYAACFAPWILTVMSFSPISTIFLLKDKQHLSLFFNLTLLISRILSVLAGGLIFKSMLWSMILYGAVGFVVWLVQGTFILKLADTTFSKKQIYLYSTILVIFLSIWIIKIHFILY